MSLKDALKAARKVQKENRELSDKDKWTPTRIRDLIANNDVFVERALCVLLKRQTPVEQRKEHTDITNYMGFTATDAKFGTSLAKQILESAEAETYPPGKRLSHKQRLPARRILVKYAHQLAVYANNKDIVRVQQALGVMNIKDFQKGGTYGKVEQGDKEENNEEKTD